MPRRQTPVPAGPFPSNGLLPKDETQAAAFLKKYPEYDGRGVRVAVLDTGVDPAAFGLNGRGKVVDIIDCTGSGDIPLKVVKPLSEDTGIDKGNKDNDKSAIRLPGVSGRTLLVSTDWNNPSGQWKVGFKRAFDLWPGDLVRRRKAERKPEWDVKVAELLSSAKKDLQDFQAKDSEAADDELKAADASKPGNTPEGKSAGSQQALSDKQQESERLAKKATKADLEARVSLLSDFAFEDPGPILEAVVWYDGSDWRAVVGGAEGDGVQDVDSGSEKDEKAILDLRNHKPMTDYRKEQQYERFGTQDLMSYSVNIVDDGKILSLAVVSGTHGTHVAAIIGGRVEDEPELSGVAPGVEIVSLQIGDARLAALETGQALMRATKAILDTKCDVCNMSFGEDAAWALEDRGQFIAMLRDEVIKKRNVIFVAAAGNAGPALSTIGAPATTSGIVSVGAYETPSMQAAEYALLDNVPAGPYTWSSRGPTYGGAMVTVYAPGAAITGVPTYNLQRSQLMNGTSMASPNACGAISLVLSAMKSEGIPISPAAISRALVATAKDVDDPLAIGLIQTEAMHKYLVDHKDFPDIHADFDVQVQIPGSPAPDFASSRGSRGGLRGIYLREAEETSKVYEASCWIKASFPTNTETEKAYNLDLKLALVATDSWVRVPNYLSLPSAGRNFLVRVDPTALAPGLHYSEVRAYDTHAPGRIVFTVPITVCKPQILRDPSFTFKEWQTTPGHIERKYLSVPEGATWAELRWITSGHDTALSFWLHCVQLLPQSRLSKTQHQSIIACSAGETSTRKFSVVGGVTMELCAAQFWNSLPTGQVNMEVHFHGLSVAQGNAVTFVGGAQLPRLTIRSQLRLEPFSPSISFDRLRAVVRPHKSEISPLGERDVMPDGNRLYQLLTTYKIKLADKLKAAPSWPITDNLYDSAFSVLTAIKDHRGRVLQFGSVYSSSKELEKGDYTVELQMEHVDLKVLERLRNICMTWDTELPEKAKGVKITLHTEHVSALTSPNSDPFKNTKLPKGATRVVVINTDLQGETKELYKIGKAGDLLLGKLSLGPSGTKEDNKVEFVLSNKATETDSEDADDDKEKPLLVDLQLSILDKIEDESEKKSFVDSLLKQYPDYLPLLLAKLKMLEKAGSADERRQAADAVLARIDEKELASHLGRKGPLSREQTKADKQLDKKMQAAKDAWTKACVARIASAAEQANEAEGAGDTSIKELLQKLRQFTDAPDKSIDYLMASAENEYRLKHYGLALQSVGNALGDAPDNKQYAALQALRRKCLAALEWRVISEYDARWKLVKEPPMPILW